MRVLAASVKRSHTRSSIHKLHTECRLRCRNETNPRNQQFRCPVKPMVDIRSKTCRHDLCAHAVRSARMLRTTSIRFAPRRHACDAKIHTRRKRLRGSARKRCRCVSAPGPRQQPQRPQAAHRRQRRAAASVQRPFRRQMQTTSVSNIGE